MEHLSRKEHLKNKGQALLLVLLSMAVVLTVVLSVASRSVTDVQVTTYEEDAYRAFSAAEAGIEELLKSPSGFTTATDTFSSGVSFDAQITQESAGSEFNYPSELESGEVATFWFVTHDPSNLNKFLDCTSGICTRASQLEVCWGGSGSYEVPAIILSIFYDQSRQATEPNSNFSAVEVFSRTFDPDSVRRADNGFDAGSGSCSFGSYTYSSGVVNLASGLPVGCAVSNPGGCLLMAKVKMVYNKNPQTVGIEVRGAGAVLPSQGILISSEGSAGEVKRKVNVLQGYPVPQSPFENVLFSRHDITK